MSAVTTTILCICWVSFGILIKFYTTGLGCCLAIFPFSWGMLEPKIVLSFLISLRVPGQLGIILECTIFLKSFSEGYPTMANARRSFFDLSYCCWYNPYLLSKTVLMRTTYWLEVLWKYIPDGIYLNRTSLYGFII